MIVDRVPVYVMILHMRTYCGRSSKFNDRMKFKNGFFFFETDGKDVTFVLSWIYYHLSAVLDVVLPGFQKEEEVKHSV